MIYWQVLVDNAPVVVDTRNALVAAVRHGRGGQGLTAVGQRSSIPA